MSTIDDCVIVYIRIHANLLRSILMLGLCIWGIWQHHVSIVEGIVITGAISYYASFLISLLIGVFWSIMSVTTEPTIGAAVSALMIYVVGFSCVSWLGYQHRETALWKHSREAIHEQTAHIHHDQVVPWAVANDIRTSLAAIRFLLFPIHEERNATELEIASRELQRLEQVFKEIEEKTVQAK